MRTQSDCFQAVIFDLDGTLLNTLADIAESVNRTLAEYHFPAHPIDAYCFFIGNGWEMLVTRALPETHRSEQVIADCVARSRKVYQENWNRQTQLYEGIPELLDNLAKKKIPLSILSNKPHDFMLKCVEWYLNKWKFKMLLGQSDNFPLKPESCIRSGSGRTDWPAAVGISFRRRQCRGYQNGRSRRYVFGGGRLGI